MKTKISVDRLEALVMFFGALVTSVICKNMIFLVIFAVIYLILLYSKK